MAEIEIQKRRRTLWPWIIVAVLVFVAVSWLLVGILATREERAPVAPSPLGEQPAQLPIQPATVPPAETPAGPAGGTPVPPAPVPASK
jgi:hypothetical protein